jgi:hypothetical protein
MMAAPAQGQIGMNDSSDDFVEIYPDALNAAACAALIGRFESSGGAVRGATGGGVDTTVKNSWDITISTQPQWADAEGALNAAMLEGLKRYLRRYPYTVLGPLWLKMKNASGEMALLEPETLSALPDERLTALARRTFRPGAINIQKYIASCIRSSTIRLAKTCTARCCGRSISTTASAKVKPNSCISGARSCRAPAAC